MEEQKETKSFIDELREISKQSDNVELEVNIKGKKSDKPQINTEEVLTEAEDKILNQSDINEQDYIKYSDNDKVSFIERELVKTIKELDMNLESINIYERKLKVKGFPAHVYEVKNSFIETKRKVLKELFDIVAHKQKMDKDIKGESFTEIIKS